MLPVPAVTWYDSERVFQTMRSQVLAASILVPVQPGIVNELDTIAMDHDRLPTMETVTFRGVDYNGHVLNSDWVWTCAMQHDGARFWLNGSSGLFSLGAAKWSTDRNNRWDAEFEATVIVTDSQGLDSDHLKITGRQNITLFLEKGSSIRLTSGDNDGTREIQEASFFVLTRHSTLDLAWEHPVD